MARTPRGADGRGQRTVERKLIRRPRWAMSSPWLAPRAPAEPPALPTVAWTAERGFGAHRRHVRGYLAVGGTGPAGAGPAGAEAAEATERRGRATVDRAAARVVGRPVQVGREARTARRDGSGPCRGPRAAGRAGRCRTASRARPGPAARPANRDGTGRPVTTVGRARTGPAGDDGRAVSRRRTAGRSGRVGRSGSAGRSLAGPASLVRAVGATGGRPETRLPLVTGAEPSGGVASAPRAPAPLRLRPRREARPPFGGAGSGATGGAAGVTGSSMTRLSPLRAGSGPGSVTGVGISPVRSPDSQPARWPLVGRRVGDLGDGGLGVGPDGRPAHAVVARGRDDGRRGARPQPGAAVGQADVDDAQLDEVAHGAGHAQLGQAEGGGELADGAPGGHGHERLPAVGTDGDLVGGQVAGEGDLVLERRHDGLELGPLAEQVVGAAEQRLDVFGLGWRRPRCRRRRRRSCPTRTAAARTRPRRRECRRACGRRRRRPRRRRTARRCPVHGHPRSGAGRSSMSSPEGAGHQGERRCRESLATPTLYLRSGSSRQVPQRSRQPRPPAARAPSVGSTTTRRDLSHTPGCDVVSCVTNCRRTARDGRARAGSRWSSRGAEGPARSSG